MLENNLRFLDDKNLVHLLLYGQEKVKFHRNLSVLKATINFVTWFVSIAIVLSCDLNLGVGWGGVGHPSIYF